MVHLLLGLAGTALARSYACRRAMIDQPGERRSHAVPTPRGGGAAIVMSLLLATGWLWATASVQRPLLAGFGIGLAMVSLVGWVDDHRPLPAWSRLVVHAVAAAAVALGAWGQYGDAFAALAGWVAIVVLVNAWNFMDGIDGLAATQAIPVALLAGTLAGPAGFLLGIALAASTTGFLPWNFPRARVFMGDVGSGAIGFSLGALAFMGGGVENAMLCLFPLSAFLLDAGLTLARRISRGERWWEPHVSHAYQRASRRHGHVGVTLAFGAWTLAGTALGWLLRDVSFTSLIISLLVWYAAGAVVWSSIQRGG